MKFNHAASHEQVADMGWSCRSDGRWVKHILLPRLMQAIATALVLASLCFAFVHALPGDTALRIAAARAGEDRLTTEAADRIRTEHGLDRPLLSQYATWIRQLLSGDLGHSMVTRKPVADELLHHANATVALGVTAWLLSYLIACPLGIIAGLWPGRMVDRATMAAATIIASLPSFLLGIALVSVFALTLQWLPPAGSREVTHMVLPASTLALGLAAFSVRVIQSAVAQVRSAFYMTFARIRGLSAVQAFRRHGLRNAAIPIVTFAALQMAYVVDGFVVVETVFAYPGLGDLLVQALLARDVPVIAGTALSLGLLYSLANLTADLLSFWLDPRRRAASTA